MMFFNDSIQRRLANLIRPWLRDDQELELKLGFLRSKGTLNNISFKVSALNELLDDPSKCCFKEVTVEHLSLQFSPFSSAAFTLVVRGLRVVLSLGEEEDEGGAKWRRKPRDTTVEERNKVLEEIDPEGCALHSAIKKILGITTRTWRTSLLNTVIRHCDLQLHDVHVLLQSPCLSDPLSCSFYMKKFGAGSQTIGHRCFIGGFMRSFFVASEETSFNVDIDNFEIRLNRENGTHCVFPGTNMLARAKWNHLKSISFCFHVPALNFSFSPADFSVMLVLYGHLSKEYKRARPGRQLWNIEATNISSLLPTSKLSLIRGVRLVCQWLRYINTYQNMLLLVGYPADEMMKRSATLMFSDSMYSRTVHNLWKLIAEIENDLPLEAIAVARRIIRYRVASKGPSGNGNFDELLATRPFSKLRQLPMLILSMIGSLLASFMRILFYKVLAIFPESGKHFDPVHETTVLQKSITLNVQEISFCVTPDNAVQPNLSRKALSDREISYQDLLSFQFSIDALFLRYLVDISERCFTFTSGCLKVVSFPNAMAGTSSYSEESWKKEVNKRQIVVWGEPAQVIYFPESTCDSATHNIAGTSVPHLDCLLGKLWLNWKDYCLKSEGENIPNVQAPWFLCETWSCMTDHSNSDSSSLYKCTLVVGKLNFNLECYSFASAVALLRQIQCALSWSARKKKNAVLHASAITIQDPLVKYWGCRFSSYSSKIEKDIIKVLPQKPVQIGALIAGPHIHVSQLNDQFRDQITNPHHLGTQVSFEICNIELLVSPNLEDNVGLSGETTSERDRGHLGLKEPQEIDISKSDNGAYSCQGQISLNAYVKVNGLKAYFDETTQNQKDQIIVLRPITTQLSYVRYFLEQFMSHLPSLWMVLVVI
ncbi:hypothetical protein CDL12_23339 [Handroanthus impetiginosus]|uniref:Uncharacterized protein n=1 Tax=Handroanthus impetiginosus TaxID=429701 RepID=A0A2G9GFQ7_9LAMI|nr:hypothetical protein CDL12_23339 [Handroanthus impetiginosus]